VPIPRCLEMENSRSLVRAGSHRPQRDGCAQQTIICMSEGLTIDESHCTGPDCAASKLPACLLEKTDRPPIG
jgi:hypothetical protein